jgi:DNA-binding transcriptional regulator LsrR (DeoR family)
LIGLDEKAEILMGYFRDNKSQRAISRETGISRDTVSKYIKEFEAKNDLLNVLKKDEEKNRNQNELTLVK